MDEKIMLSDEELNQVAGGSYEDNYFGYTRRKAANRKEVDSLEDFKCPCCGLKTRLEDKTVYVCERCRILWRMF